MGVEDAEVDAVARVVDGGGGVAAGRRERVAGCVGGHGSRQREGGGSARRRRGERSGVGDEVVVQVEGHAACVDGLGVDVGDVFGREGSAVDLDVVEVALGVSVVFRLEGGVGAERRGHVVCGRGGKGCDGGDGGAVDVELDVLGDVALGQDDDGEVCPGGECV